MPKRNAKNGTAKVKDGTGTRGDTGGEVDVEAPDPAPAPAPAPTADEISLEAKRAAADEDDAAWPPREAAPAEESEAAPAEESAAAPAEAERGAGRRRGGPLADGECGTGGHPPRGAAG